MFVLYDVEAELVMGWVHPLVGLGQSLLILVGWVGLGGDLTA